MFSFSNGRRESKQKKLQKMRKKINFTFKHSTLEKDTDFCLQTAISSILYATHKLQINK